MLRSVEHDDGDSVPSRMRSIARREVEANGGGRSATAQLGDSGSRKRVALRTVNVSAINYALSSASREGKTKQSSRKTISQALARTQFEYTIAESRVENEFLLYVLIVALVNYDAN